MKKFLYFISFLTAIFILSGCVDVYYSVEIQKDGTAQTKLTAYVDKNAANVEDVESFIEEYAIYHLEYPLNEFYPYSVVETDEYIVFETEAIDLEDRDISISHFGAFNITGTATSTKENLPFYTFYSMSIKRELSDESALQGYISKMLLREHFTNVEGNLNVELHVTVPDNMTLNEHNADFEADDSQKLVWYVDPFERQEWELSFTNNQLYIPAIFLVIGAAAIAYFFVRNRKKKQPNQ